jgi:phosphatidylserine/phosphatidylglycerophosphate/cardiolipin synthase-like enzyme
MKEFRFSSNKEAIRKVIREANEFISVVSFQFSDGSFIRDLLWDKLRKVDLSIITLPTDSYKDTTQRNKIDKLYRDLEENGAKVYRCMWEVGDPSLTATSLSGEQLEGGGNKWYSMHGKFIVTEKSALVMSSNFTEAEEMEVYLTISDSRVIKRFREKFDQLKALFIDENKYPGKIYDLVDTETKTYIRELRRSSGRLNVKAYPPNLAPSTSFVSGLYLTPFDGRARGFLDSFIDGAQRFLYLSTERFFDDETARKLVAKAMNTETRIRLITCPPNQIRQNPAKAEQMISELLSAGIEIMVFENIHAKCWISDKYLAIGSINLGKMNLGFRKTGDSWRANTETIYFDSDKKLIRQAKSEFDGIYEKGTEPLRSISLSSKYRADSKALFGMFGVRSDEGARETIGQIQTSFKVNSRRSLLRVVDIAAKIVQRSNVRVATRKEVLMALILFYLSERKHVVDELLEKLGPIVEGRTEVEQALKSLIKNSLVVRQEDFYKIDIGAIL